MRNFTSIDADKVPASLNWDEQGALYANNVRIAYATDSAGAVWRQTKVVAVEDSDFGRVFYAVA